ncbi:MAG: response regulator [Deltaproteobacteria bacterium]|nr:MAG: response regulator [Deltaproteobacteria bacterium]
MNEKIKVLMVDDEKQFRATTKKILNRRGFETILAASGEEAIDKLNENPDVVILDVKMHGMDGHQVLKEIKKRVPGIPVIMLTGHGALPSAEKALADGAVDYLTKPCDIDLLSAKINDAFQYNREPGIIEEKRVLGVMVTFEEYSTISEDASVKDAILKLKTSFTSIASTSRIMETGHRSILVMDNNNKNVIGSLAITDLLEMIMPAYLSAPKPSTADTIQYSPMFWAGMFSKEIKRNADTKIKDVMSPAPITIDGKASLMEAAYMMLENKVRRLAVVVSGEVVGVIREQDLFFEMERILRE